MADESIYGDAQQPDTLVVTERDHLKLLRDPAKEALLEEVRRAIRRNTVLFLGYNLADPDFRFLFGQIAESNFARTRTPSGRDYRQQILLCGATRALSF